MAEDFRSKHPELGSKKIVLYAGTLGVINGVSYFVDLAFEASKLSSDVCFVIIGGGKEWDLVNARAIELGVLNKSLFMYPSIPKTDLLSAFAAASISTSLFVDLKPMEANSANKFFDSLASGTAVAINYGGWQVPVLESYQAGLQLSRNVSSAALQIIDLLNNETKLEEMGRNARRLAEEQFSRDVLASRLERCLTDVVGES
jgi:glycosyltransferase involved in cell wall biosynthesis